MYNKKLNKEGKAEGKIQSKKIIMSPYLRIHCAITAESLYGLANPFLLQCGPILTFNIQKHNSIQ